MEFKETVIGYYHNAGTDHAIETLGDQPVFYSGHRIGKIEFKPDGHGNVEIRWINESGDVVQDLGKEHDSGWDEAHIM